jgi:hypothetical protein
MRSVIHVSALLLALGVAIGLVTYKHLPRLAASETVGVGGPSAGVADEFDEPTGSLGLAAAPRLRLSDEERGFIFLGVINLPDVPDVAMHAPPISGSLPETVALRDIPAMVVRRIPQVRDYGFVKLDDRILLVNAATREVAAMIPRYKLIVQ